MIIYETVSNKPYNLIPSNSLTFLPLSIITFNLNFIPDRVCQNAFTSHQAYNLYITQPLIALIYLFLLINMDS